MDIVTNILLYIIVFFFGASLGSFALVVVRRNHSEEKRSWHSGKSICESCKKELRAWELIPTISYICLGGKCARCKSKIDPTHFFCETATGIAYTILFYFYSIGSFDLWKFLLLMIAHTVLITLSFSDILYREINVIPIYVVGGLGAVYHAIATKSYINLIIVISLFVVFGLITSKFDFITLGGGDIDVCVCLFALTNRGMSMIDIVFYAALYGIVLGLTVLRKSDRNIPFVPCLYFGYILCSFGISFTDSMSKWINVILTL